MATTRKKTVILIRPTTRVERDIKPYEGSDTCCVDCDEPVRAGDLVVREGETVLCERCENDAFVLSDIRNRELVRLGLTAS
jgi:hypothetical protein